MTDQSIQISFSLSSVKQDKYLLIEQEPWGKDVGKTTTLQALQAVEYFVYGGNLPSANCGGDQEGFDAPVYVYPSKSLGGLYKFHINDIPNNSYIRGDVENGILAVDFLIRDEIVQCGFSNSIELKYPPQSIKSISTVNFFYDKSGNITARPDITISDRTVSFSKKVYGSFRVVYSVRRDTYMCRVENRDENTDNTFNAIVYCVFNGGVNWLEITPPTGYDYSEGACGNGYYIGVSIVPDDPYDPPGRDTPYADEKDKTVLIDYCSQEIIGDRIK